MEGGEAKPVLSVGDARKPAMARRLLRLEGKKKPAVPKADDRRLAGIWEQYHLEEEGGFQDAGRAFYHVESSHSPMVLNERGGRELQEPGLAGLGAWASMPRFAIDTPMGFDGQEDLYYSHYYKPDPTKFTTVPRHSTK